MAVLLESTRTNMAEITRLAGGWTSVKQTSNEEKMAQYAQEEKHIRQENLRLQRKLQLEMERRESLCRHLSESESSLEMDDERQFNEMAKHHDGQPQSIARPRTVSSPIPYVSPSTSRPLSPGIPYPAFSPPSPMRRTSGGSGGSSGGASGSAFHPPSFVSGTSPPVHSHMTNIQRQRPSQEKFIRPSSYPGPDKHEKT